VSVAARRVYAHPARPFLPDPTRLAAPQADDGLNPDDVTGN